MTDTMAIDSWDPRQYDKFEREREQPFYDLLSLVRRVPAMRVASNGALITDDGEAVDVRTPGVRDARTLSTPGVATSDLALVGSTVYWTEHPDAAPAALPAAAPGAQPLRANDIALGRTSGTPLSPRHGRSSDARPVEGLHRPFCPGRRRPRPFVRRLDANLRQCAGTRSPATTSRRGSWDKRTG